MPPQTLRPEAPNKSEFEYLTSICPEDGTQIRYVKAGPLKNAEHVLVYFQGRAEWLEKYEFLYHDLCKERGWGFLAIDHRGQGASGGKAAHIDSYDIYVNDALRIINKEIPKVSYSILAHSMGGLIAVYGTLKEKFSPRQLSLSAPLLGLPQTPLPRVIASPFANKMCELGFSKTDTAFGRHEVIPFPFNRLTSDREKYRFIQNSPYKIPGPTFGWVKASFEATDYIFHDSCIAKLNCPVQMHLGTKEGVVDPKAVIKWAQMARLISEQPIELVEIKGAKHELLFEKPAFYNKVLANILNFLK